MYWQTLVSSRTQVLGNLPKFNEYLVQLQEEMALPVRDLARLESIQSDAATVKQTLHLIFDHYEAALYSSEWAYISL
jgi:hypothetical protein